MVRPQSLSVQIAPSNFFVFNTFSKSIDWIGKRASLSKLGTYHWLSLTVQRLYEEVFTSLLGRHSFKRVGGGEVLIHAIDEGGFLENSQLLKRWQR